MPYSKKGKPIKLTSPDGRTAFMPWNKEAMPSPAEVDAFARQAFAKTKVPLAPANQQTVVPQRRQKFVPAPNPIVEMSQGRPPVKQVAAAQDKAAEKNARLRISQRDRMRDENFGVPEQEIANAQTNYERRELIRRQKLALAKQQAAAMQVANNAKSFDRVINYAKETGGEAMVDLADGRRLPMREALTETEQSLKGASAFVMQPRDMEQEMMDRAAYNPRMNITTPTDAMGTGAAFTATRPLDMMQRGVQEIYQGTGQVVGEGLNPGIRRAVYEGVRKQGGSDKEAAEALKVFEETFGQLSTGIVSGGMQLEGIASKGMVQLGQALDATDFIAGMGPQLMMLADPKISKDRKKQIAESLLNPTAVIPMALPLLGKGIAAGSRISGAAGEVLPPMGKRVGDALQRATAPTTSRIAGGIDRITSPGTKNRKPITAVQNLDLRNPGAKPIKTRAASFTLKEATGYDSGETPNLVGMAKGKPPVEEVNPGEAGTFYYRTSVRPPGVGAVPDGFDVISYGSHGDAYISYSRRLTPEEVEHFSLAPATKARAESGKFGQRWADFKEDNPDIEVPGSLNSGDAARLTKKFYDKEDSAKSTQPETAPSPEAKPEGKPARPKLEITGDDIIESALDASDADEAAVSTRVDAKRRKVNGAYTSLPVGDLNQLGNDLKFLATRAIAKGKKAAEWYAEVSKKFGRRIMTHARKAWTAVYARAEKVMSNLDQWDRDRIAKRGGGGGMGSKRRGAVQVFPEGMMPPKKQSQPADQPDPAKAPEAPAKPAKVKIPKKATPLTPEEEALSILSHEPKQKGERNRDLAERIEKFVRSKIGGKKLDASKPESRIKIARAMARDAWHEIVTNPTTNAVGWYERKVAGALKAATVKHPELATNETANLAYKFALAVTSNGMRVKDNLGFADYAYSYYKKNGKMPVIGRGKAAAAMKDAFKLWNDMTKGKDVVEFMKLLNSEFTPQQFEAMTGKKSGELGGQYVSLAHVLGPKIGGGFLRNLMGHFDSLTTDRWLQRTWGRMTGNLTPENAALEAKYFENFRKEVENASDDLISSYGDEYTKKALLEDEDLLAEFAKDVHKRYGKKDKKTGKTYVDRTDFNVAGKTLDEYYKATNDAPSAQDRINQRAVFELTKEILEKEYGIKINTADLQATVWYPEQRLYGMDANAIDYEQAAKEFYGSEKPETDGPFVSPEYRTGSLSAKDRLAELRSRILGKIRRGSYGGVHRRFPKSLPRGYSSASDTRTTAELKGKNAGRKVRIKDSYTLTQVWKNKIAYITDGNGAPIHDTPDFMELADPATFRELALEARESLGPIGQAVDVYKTADEYAGARLLATRDGTVLVAVKADGDIVSVVKHSDSPYNGTAVAQLQMAIDIGGRKLDAYDVVTGNAPNLPDLYSRSGFVEVARMKFDPAFARPDWDYKTMGEPDVVFMAYDPKSTGKRVKTDNYVTDYNEGVRLQSEFIEKIPGQTLDADAAPRMEAKIKKNAENAVKAKAKAAAERAAKAAAKAADPNATPAKKTSKGQGKVSPGGKPRTRAEAGARFRQSLSDFLDEDFLVGIKHHSKNKHLTGSVSAINPKKIEEFEKLVRAAADYGIATVEEFVDYIVSEAQGLTANQLRILKDAAREIWEKETAPASDVLFAKNALKQNRIPVAPLAPPRGFKPKTAGQIILNIGKEIGRKIASGAVRGRGVLGTYNPTTGSMRIRYNDIDTASHELGHMLDDVNGFGKDVVGTKAEPEVMDLYKQSGKPPAKQDLMLKEGMADFFRGVVLNPDLTAKTYPELWKRYESLIPADIRKKIKKFSDEVRMAESVDPVRYSASQVRKPERVGFIAKLRESFKEDDNVFKVDGWTKLSEVLLNDQASLEAAVRFVQRQTGLTEINVLSDPVGLGGDLRYINQKVESYIENGIRSPDTGELISDAKIADIDKILAGDGKLTAAEYELRRDAFLSYLINERTLEYERKFVDEAREKWIKIKGTAKGFRGSRAEAVALRRAERGTGIGRGIRSDTAVAREGLNAFNLLPADQQAQIKKAADIYRQVASDVLDYGVAGGRWTQEWADSIRAGNLHYAAMKRIVEGGPSFSASGKMTQARTVVKKVKGGTYDLVDPVIGLIENVSKTIFEVDRNNVMKALRDLVQVAPREMYDKAQNPNLASIMDKVPEGTKGAIKIYVNGNVEHWRIADPALQKSLDAIGKFSGGDLDGVINLLGFPGRVLRQFVTTSPGFIIRNMIRDSLQRPLVSDINMARRKPGDWLRFASDDEKRMMRELGGSLTDDLYSGNARREKVRFNPKQGFYLEDAAQYNHIQQQLIKDALKDPKTIILERGKNAAGILGRLSQGSELKGRVAEFRAAFRDGKAKGMSDYEAQVYAARKSRELIDYLRAGKTVRQLNRLIPFLNASIQGLDREIRTMKRSPGKYATRFGLITLLPSLLVRLFNQEQGAQEEYEQQPGYLRDMFFMIKIPGQDGFIRIPKPFMAGVMGAGAERSLDYASAAVSGDKVRMDKAFEGYSGRLLSQFMPIDQSVLMGGSYAPFLEIMVNKDLFRDREIIPAYEKDLAPHLQKSRERSSNISKEISGAAKMVGRNVDPRHADHIMRAYTGDFGKMAIASTDGKYVDDMAKLNMMFGLFSGSPGGNSEDVQWVKNMAATHGAGKPFEKLSEAFYEATNESERNSAAKALRERAADLRRKLRDSIEGKSPEETTRITKALLK